MVPHVRQTVIWISTEPIDKGAMSFVGHSCFSFATTRDEVSLNALIFCAAEGVPLDWRAVCH